MKETLESIQKHIEVAFFKEKPKTRYGFIDKYSGIFSDIVYKVAIENKKINLNEVVRELKEPVFKYNSSNSELFICSPIFRLLFNLNGTYKFSDIPVEKWFDRNFWNERIKTANGSKLGYSTKQGDIPEFMVLIQKKEGKIAVHILKCKYFINLETDAEFLTEEAPMIFELDNTDPMILVRYLMAI